MVSNIEETRHVDVSPGACGSLNEVTSYMHLNPNTQGKEIAAGCKSYIGNPDRIWGDLT